MILSVIVVVLVVVVLTLVSRRLRGGRPTSAIGLLGWLLVALTALLAPLPVDASGDGARCGTIIEPDHRFVICSEALDDRRLIVAGLFAVGIAVVLGAARHGANPNQG